MTSQDDPSQFPKFADADVLIYLSGGRVYALHAGVLRRNSTRLAAVLDDANGATLTTKARKEGTTVRFRLGLVRADVGPGTLVARPVDANGRSSVSSTALNIENGKVVNAVYKHYDNLFRAFYNKPPEVDDTNIATVLNDCMGLIDVAESLGAIECISESVDIALLRHGQVLFRSVAGNPIAWSDLACRVRSPSIFKECLIHLVGNWQGLDDKQRALIKPEVREICEMKHQQQKVIKMAIEVRALGHYPASVQRSVEQSVGRMTYQNNIYMWMGISLFRHWFSQSIVEQRNLMSEDGGALFYRQIAAGGQAYLDRQALEGFHQYFPMSAKGAAVFTNHLTKYKDEVRHFVASLVVNRAQLDTEKHPLPYLTCLEVERDDMPWVKAKLAEEAARAMKDRASKRKHRADDDSEGGRGNSDDDMSDVI